jgi:apolipoprotein N-acyltransferase
VTATCALALIATPVLHALAFPPARLWWLGWVCFVPWFTAIRITRLWVALAVTSCTTLLGTYLVASWLPSAVARYYDQGLLVGLLFFAGAWALTIAPWVWAFTLTYRALARRSSRSLPLLGGAAWTANELARTRLFLGDPFGLFGYSQVDALPLVQIADVTGVYGISFLLAAVNVALAEMCITWMTRSNRPRPQFVSNQLPSRLRGLLLVSVLLLGVVGYGLVRLQGSANAIPGTRLAIIQGNVDPGAQWARQSYGQNLEAYLALTREARAARPELVVWPENAMNFFADDEPLYRRAIADQLAPADLELVAGGPRASDGAAPRYYNAAFVIAPDGAITAVYDKQRLLPFAEYFPLASIELLRREFARVREFTPGGPAAPLPTRAGPAGVLICNEAFFGEIAGDRVAHGAGYLLNLANDSWLGDAKYAEQALDMARLRAVEQRRYLVRASTSGPSAIVDPRGRVEARTGTETAATLTGTIRSRNEITVYGRAGDTFALACAVLALAALLRRKAPDSHSRQDRVTLHRDDGIFLGIARMVRCFRRVCSNV